MKPRQHQPPTDVIGSRAAGLMLAVVLLAFAASRIAVIDLPFEREFDEGVYLLSARSVAAGNSLFSEVFSSQPPAFLESLAAALRLFDDSLRTGRMFILAFALISVAATAAIARLVASTVVGASSASWAAPGAAAALALTLTFGDLAHVVQAEIPALGLALVSIWACLRAREHDWHRGWLLASGALFATSVLFKLIVFPMALPLELLLLLRPARNGRAAWSFDACGAGFARRILGRGGYVAAGAIAVGCVPLLVYDRHALYAQNIAFHFAKYAAYGHNRLVNLTRAGEQLFDDATVSATAVAGLAMLLWRNRPAGAWLVVWFFAAVVAIMEQTPLFWRHFVLLSPPLAVLAGMVVAMSLETFRWQARLVATLALAALWITPATMLPGHRGAALAWRETTQRHDSAGLLLNNLSAWIRDHTSPGDFVAGDDPLAIYLADRQAPPRLCDTSQARIVSGNLSLREATRSSIQAPLIVLQKKGRLSHLGGYLRWLGRNYEAQPRSLTGPLGQRTFWVRKND